MEKTILLIMLLLLIGSAAAATASSLIPNTGDLGALGVQNANLYNTQDNDRFGYARHYFNGSYGDAGIAIIIGVKRADDVPKPGNITGEYSCKTTADGYLCYKHGSPIYNSKKYQYGAAFWGARKVGNYSVNVRVIGDYNTTDPTVLGPKILQMVANRIESGPKPTLSVIKPKEGEQIIAKNGSAVIDVEATAQGADYVGAHYESSRPKPTMIGGEMTKSGGTYKKTIVVSGDDLAYGDALIRIYAKNDSGGVTEVVRHVKIVRTNTSAKQQSAAAGTGKEVEVNVNISKEKVKSALETVKKAVPDVAGNPLEFPAVEHIDGVLSEGARRRMSTTEMKISMVAMSNGLSTAKVKTPSGERTRIYAEGSKGKGATWFKTKYYGNKVTGKIIDGVANHLPAPLQAITGYVKDSVQNATMNEEEKVKATAKDLGVDEKSAENYNKMNAVEDREKKLNAIKSTIPTSGLTKPFDFILNQMGISVKKIIASDYGWEYRETMKRAVEHKKSGMKYQEIIQNTIRDMEEMYGTDHRTYLLDRSSKKEYRNQEARIRLYLQQLYEERKI